MPKNKTLWKYNVFISLRLHCCTLLKKIWGCDDGRVGSKKDDLKNLSPTFASMFLTAQTEKCLLKTKTAKGPRKASCLPRTASPEHRDFPAHHMESHAGTADGQCGQIEDEGVTWEWGRTSLFWPAWMKLGKPDLNGAWSGWGTWGATRWASREKSSVTRRLRNR